MRINQIAKESSSTSQTVNEQPSTETQPLSARYFEYFCGRETRKYKFFSPFLENFHHPYSINMPSNKMSPHPACGRNGPLQIHQITGLEVTKICSMQGFIKKIKGSMGISMLPKVRQQPFTARLAPASSPSLSSKGKAKVKHHDSFSSSKDSTLPHLQQYP